MIEKISEHKMKEDSPVEDVRPLELLNVIENKELGISYTEKIEELSEEKQEQTGIKKLRKIRLITYPDYFFDQNKGFAVSGKILNRQKRFGTF